MDNFDFKKYINNNPLLKEDDDDDDPRYSEERFTPNPDDITMMDDEEIDIDLDGIADYDHEIYVPPHVKDEDLVVRADSQNYRLPVEFLVDMAEQFGDMGNDAMSFVDETVARFVQVGIAEAEKDKLYNWFDNIMYAEGTMSEGFNFKKYIKNNPLLK